ncbi:hypothetical protein F5887DRAFT_877576 [Amanita rubescens]|nr:hypothetical protein F5887DRAFT_877576 [Amanita rubescens]
MSDNNLSSSTVPTSTQSTQSAPARSRDLVRDCDKIIERYHSGVLEKSEALASIIRIIPESTTLGSQGFNAFTQYLARLEEEDDRNLSAAQRGRQASSTTANSNESEREQNITTSANSNESDPSGSSDSQPFEKAQPPRTHTFTRACSPGLEGNGVKRAKIDDTYLPWLDKDAIDEQLDTERIKEDLAKTRRQLAEYRKDPRSVLDSVLDAMHHVSFPESEWLAIIKGHAANFDKIHNHRLSLSTSYKATRHIAQGLDFVIEDPEPPNKVKSQGDWENVWYSFFQACTFIFPHRANELREYHEWVHNRFEACHPSFHQRVINLDVKIRNFVASRRDISLEQSYKFSHLEGSYIHEWGAGYIATKLQTSERGAIGGTSSSRRVQAPCIRFNEGRCPNSSGRCRFLHVCSKCRRGGHVVEKCTASSDKPRTSLA